MSNNVINFLLFSRKLEEPSHATNIFTKRALAVRGCNTLASRLHTSENSKHAVSELVSSPVLGAFAAYS